jgi:uncharacterized protein (DUF433 family)
MMGFKQVQRGEKNRFNDTCDERICGGEPVFIGTRVMVRTALASLAAGDTPESILEQFPSLKAEHIEAAKDFRG